MTTLVNQADHPGQSQKGDNCQSQQHILLGAKTRCGSQKEVLQYISNVQNDHFIVVHRDDSCRQSYHDTRMNSSPIELFSQKGKRTCVAPDRCNFQNASNLDVMVVCKYRLRWHKGPAQSKIKVHCHRTSPLSSHCANDVVTAAILFHMSWRIACPLVSGAAAVHQCNVVCRKAKFHKQNKQECNTLSLRDVSRDWRN